MITDKTLKQLLSIQPYDIPERVYRRAAYHLLDTVGVMFAGIPFDQYSQKFLSIIKMQSGKGEGSVAGSMTGMTTAYAAMYNAILSHTVEMDDTHSAASLHPGTVIVPTALALGEQLNCSGRKVLFSIIMGYELMIRLGKSLQPDLHYRRGFHPTATCGVFGAALSASILHSLQPEVIRNALGLAGSYASGNCKYQTEASLAKRLQPGIAAYNGIFTADLAREGIFGPHNIFDDYNGFLRSHSDDPAPQFLTRDIGEQFEIENTGFKFYPCCRYNHAAIDGIINLMKSNDIDVNDIRSIKVGVTGAAMPIVVEPSTLKKAPRTIFDAQFSLYASVALAAVYGEVDDENYRIEAFSEPKVADALEKIVIEHHEELDRYYPQHWPVNISIRTESSSYETFILSCIGEPDMLDYGMIERKFMYLSSKVLPESEASELLQLALSAEKSDNIADFTRKFKFDYVGDR